MKDKYMEVIRSKDEIINDLCARLHARENADEMNIQSLKNEL